MNEGLFGPARQLANPTNPQAVESMARINAASLTIDTGWHGAVILEPYQQKEGTTCFFSGPITVARAFRGVTFPEQPIAQRARQLGLLDGRGAVTLQEEQRIALEQFIGEETGIGIKFHPTFYWETDNRHRDLALLDILTSRGNAALVLYATSDQSYEWETFFGVTKVTTEPGVRWHSNFSPKGRIRERSTPEMASLLYGIPKNPYLLICEMQVQTPLNT